MKWLSAFTVLLVGLLGFTSLASADVVVPCTDKEEGDACTTQVGTDGTCQMEGGSLTCVESSSSDDAGVDGGTEDTGTSGSEDAGSMDDAGSNGTDDDSDDDSDDDGGCNTTGSGPLGTFGPMALGLGILVAVRRRD